MKVKMGCDEKWKRDAMMEDTVVAELLLQLNNAPPPPPKQALSAKWKVSQRRSKSLTRVSPTTPLSWSGGASFSGGIGGVAVDFLSEESSQPQPILKKLQSSRSKVTSEATTGKRPRKKKTLAELKAAEIALEEERKQLIVEVKRVRANLDRERSSNEKLKRFKLELESQTAKGEGGFSSSSEVAVTSTPTQKLAPSAPLATTIPRMGSIDVSPKQRSPFEIPDLNLPVEDGCAEAHHENIEGFKRRELK